MSTHHDGGVILILDCNTSSITSSLSSYQTNHFQKLRQTFQSIRKEFMEEFIDYLNCLSFMHSHPPPRSKVTKLYNYIKSNELKQRFALDYLKRDVWFVREFSNDEEFMLKAIRQRKQVMDEFSTSDIWKSKSFILKAIKLWSNGLKYVDQSVLDHEIVSVSLEFRPNSLEYCDKTIRNNKEMVLNCIGKHYTTILFIGDSLLDDIDILRRCFPSQRRKTLTDSMSKLDLMREIVKRFPLSIFKFYKWLKDEIDFIVKPFGITMIAKSIPEIDEKYYHFNGNILRFVEDLDVVKKIIRVSPQRYYSLSDNVKEQEEIFKLTISLDSRAIDKIPQNLSNNIELFYWIYENGHSNYETDSVVCYNFSNDNKLTNDLFKKHFIEGTFFLMPHYLSSNRNLCRLAIQNNPRNFTLFSNLYYDEELLLMAVKLDPSLVKDLYPDNQLIIKCLQECPKCCSYLTNFCLSTMLRSIENTQFLYKFGREHVIRAFKSRYPTNEELEKVISVDPTLFCIFPSMVFWVHMNKDKKTHCAKMAIEKGLDTRGKLFQTMEISRDEEIIEFIESRTYKQ